MASNELEVLDPAATVDNQQSAAARALDRRRFMAALGLTGAAAGAAILAGCSDNTVYPPYVTPGATQPETLNFLLNVKFLTATFYSFITQGADLPSNLLSGSGVVTGAPSKIAFSGSNAQQTTDLLNEIYFDEVSHITALQTALGSQAAVRPAINLGASGAITAANALAIARAFEDLSITAFTGALAQLSSGSLNIAVQILSTDGFQAGALRLVSIQDGVTAVRIDSLDVAPYDPGSATAAAAGPTASGGFFTTAGAATSSASVPAGFAFTRTSSQVLAFLYGASAAGTTSGGFFPSGATGTIKSV